MDDIFDFLIKILEITHTSKFNQEVNIFTFLNMHL
jgi:hypothetical protein